MNPIPAEAREPREQPQDQEDPDERQPPHRDEVGVGEQVRLAGQPLEQAGEGASGLTQVARRRPRWRGQLCNPLVEEVPANEDPQQRDRDHRPAGERRSFHVTLL